MDTYTFKTPMPESVVDLVYGSFLSVVDQIHGLDSSTRDISFTRDLLTMLNIQLSQWPRVTVTGSKGKGSTSVLLASILDASGERVGLITSPDMRSFNERIRIGGHCVSDEELASAAQEIAPAVRIVASRITPPRYLGPGGIILALAATIFARSNISVLIVEAGRGGEYDEARLVEANVSILTPIMMEHPDKLGPTVQDIARTKTYITAPGSTIVTAPQSDLVRPIITQIAAELASPVISVYSDIFIEHPRQDPSGIVCDIRMGDTLYSNLHVSLAGLHQAENAATAILAAHALAPFGVKCTVNGVYAGANRVHWPGRAQILRKNPWILLDGAINRESAEPVCRIVSHYPAKRVTAVVGVPRPKDLEGLCSEVAKVADQIVITEVPVPSLTWYTDAPSIASRYCSDVQYITPAEEAFKYAITQAHEDEGIILLGTQSFLGSALKFWDVDTCTIW